MKDIAALREKALQELEKAGTPESLEAWRISYLGRKGIINGLVNNLKEMPLEEKKNQGAGINSLKQELETAFTEKKENCAARAGNQKTDIDLTVPGIPPAVGHLHLLTQVEQDITRIFNHFNFSVVDGPELETEWYNFDALNIPKNHPTRDLQDTLWVKSDKGLLMRTQTSPVQIRHMQKHAPPLRIISIGRVFRHEATDASHETNFYQCEGLMVGEDINFAHLKYIITEFFKQFFGTVAAIRFRPSYFPFVEPGLEVDIKIQTSQWLEVMGAGLVHSRVFEAVHYDPKKVRGFAFGMGLDRLAMIKYSIPDIRLLYNGDLRFINQF